MIDWQKPIAFESMAGMRVAARPSGLDLGGKGVYVYSRSHMSPLLIALLDPDDPGMWAGYFDHTTGESLKGWGRIVNAPSDLLADWVDPQTGREKTVKEREARRREQQAATAAGTAPAGDPVKTIVVAVTRASGHQDVIGTLEV